MVKSVAYISKEVVYNTELSQSDPLFFFFLQETLHTRSFLSVRLLSVLGISELDLGRHKLPLTVSVLEGFSVWLVNQVAVKLAAEHDVPMHCLRSDFCDLLILELQKSIASASGCLGRPRDS